MYVNFYKYHVNGNDFILIENLESKIKNYEELSKKLCRRRYSIGADGLIVLEKGERANFMMRIFNPDGSEAEMCGNGLACVAKHIYERYSNERILHIETISGEKVVEIVDEYVKLDMGKPYIPEEFHMKILGFDAYHINTGVPHTVIFVKNLKEFDVINIGRKIRYDKRFKNGTNVDFVEIINDREIFVRIYERGVEDETLSCGTGLCAVASVISILKKSFGKYKLITPGGESIVEILGEGDEIKSVYLYLKPVFVFRGEIDIS